MKTNMRPYRSENDYWRIREFLRQVMILNDLREKSWHVARLDYWRWHGIENCHVCDSLEKVIYLWETGDGQLAAVLNAEGRGDAFLQVHPTLRTNALLEEMVAAAEQYLPGIGENGKHTLTVYVDSNDRALQQILSRRGYARQGAAEHQHRRLLDAPIPGTLIPLGYMVRSLGDEGELPARSWLSWKGFHPDEPDEKYEGWEWYLNIQRCPLYRRDLDLVAVAPDGELASFCTIWYDDVTRSAYYEPVATHPNHLRRGLGKAVMSEGLRRLQRMGALAAFVGGYSPRANALYDSLAPDFELSEPWQRDW